MDMAKTWPWNAPECGETWLYDFWAAQSTDIYSFGLLCLWTLFNEDCRNAINEPLNSDTYHWKWIEDLRGKGAILTFASSQVEMLTCLDPTQKRKLQQFFELSLAQDPKSRNLLLEGLIYQFGENHNIHFAEGRPTEFPRRRKMQLAAEFQVVLR
jgi:hypothetical protein